MTLKLELRSKFKTGKNWIQNTMRWLMKKTKDKSKIKKKTLKGNFEKLDGEQKMMDQIFEANTNNKSSGNNNSSLKTVVYNNRNKVLLPNFITAKNSGIRLKLCNHSKEISTY